MVVAKILSDYGYVFFGISVVLFVGMLAYIYYTRRRQDGGRARDVETPPTRTAEPRTSAGELECRRVLEKHFAKPFAKTRPDFLRNDVTSTETAPVNLELDCYNAELKLAVEYNGRQHYEFVKFFHRTRDAFHNQKYRDQMKRDKCRAAGVALVEVPYTIPVERIEEYILGMLRSLQIKIPTDK